tara:strand:- start:66 stop:452 length:387 start_codon:yes stop_codon:yes gene_type:complete
MLILLMLSVATAEPQFTNLDKGQKAPFAGKLLNDEAIAEIIAKKHLSEAMCKAMIDKSVEVAEAKVTYGCDIAIAEHEMLIRNLKTENEYLKKKEKRSKWTVPVAVTVGVGGGFILGVGSLSYIILGM